MDTNFTVLIALMGLEIGGAETHVLELCKALKNKGVNVIVVSNGGIYEKELTDSGVIHIKAPLHNKSLINIYKSYKILKKTIIENNIKLVHSHARIPSFLLGILHKKLGFRFVTTAHLDFKTTFPFNILSNWGEASLAVSDDIKTYLVDKYGVNKDKILLTINGIDIEKFSPLIDCYDLKQELNLAEDVTRIVYLSRMDTDRSLVAHQLIEITPYLYNKYKNIEILIVGGGDDFESVQKEANIINKQIGKNIIVLTNARTDINKCLQTADFFIGVSRAALEAMATGKPCIITGNQGYIGIFDENVKDVAIDTNFCCRGLQLSTTELIKKDFDKLFSYDKKEIERLGNFGRNVIKEIYSVDSMANDALKLYELVSMSKRQVDVIISGYYGFRNNGDDTILKSIIDGIRKEKQDAKIIILSKRPKETEEIYNIETINRFNLIKIWRTLKNTRLLLSGGGTLIQDLTSTQSLIYYLSIIFMASKRGTKNMLYANGIGPINIENNKKITRNVLNKVELISLRDTESLTVLNELNIDKPIKEVTADPAFSYVAIGKENGKLLEELGLQKNRYFVVSIRTWKFLKDDFEEKIANFCDFVGEKYDILPVFIPMQNSNDTEISKRIINKLKIKAYFLEQDHTTDDLMEIINQSNFVLSMRLHTIIYSIKVNTPVIGLVYDPKVENMMNAIGQETYMNVGNIEEVKLVQHAKYIMDNREKIILELKEFEESAKTMAYKNNSLAISLINKREF